MRTIEAEPARVPIVLTTTRLRLRRPQTADVDSIVELADDWMVARYTARIPHPYIRSDAEAFLESIDTGWENGSEFVFMITTLADGAQIGLIGLILDDDPGAATLGFFLGRPFWRKGYMGEALRAVLDYAFGELGLIRVSAAAFLENAASIKVQERIGMTLVGRDFEEAPARGRKWPVVVHEVTRETWGK